jgi:hypothetical protein
MPLDPSSTQLAKGKQVCECGGGDGGGEGWLAKGFQHLGDLKEVCGWWGPCISLLGPSYMRFEFIACILSIHMPLHQAWKGKQGGLMGAWPDTGLGQYCSTTWHSTTQEGWWYQAPPSNLKKNESSCACHAMSSLVGTRWGG